MELSFDWRSFQTVFHPPRRILLDDRAGPSRVYVVVEGDRVAVAYAEQEDLRDWTGASLEELQKQNPDRMWRIVSASELQRAVVDARKKTHFHGQVEAVRVGVSAGMSRAEGVDFQLKAHFLLAALTGGWQRVLPASFGIALRLTDGTGGAVRHTTLLLVKKGAIEGFFEPDLSAFEASGRNSPEELSKYLGERYLSPVLVATVSKESWSRWSKDLNPWGEVSQAVARKELDLFPKSWGIRSIISLKTVL